MFSKMNLSQFISVTIVITLYFTALFSTTNQSKVFMTTVHSVTSADSLNVLFGVSPTGSPKAQTSPTAIPTPAYSTFTIGQCSRFQVKTSGKVSSSTAKKGDYVEFKVVDDVLTNSKEIIKKDTAKEEKDPTQERAGNNAPPYKAPQALIKGGTIALGTVSDAKHRHFPGFPGILKVRLDKVKAVDGTLIPVFIVRHYLCDDSNKKQRCSNYNPPCAEQPALAVQKEGLKFRTEDINSKKDRSPGSGITGRRNYPVATTVPALLTVLGTVTGLTLAKDKTTTLAIAFFTFFEQTGVNDLINGTDAQLDADEIFDVYVLDNHTINVKNETSDKSSPKTDGKP